MREWLLSLLMIGGTVALYRALQWLQRRMGWMLLNPLLWSVIFWMAALKLTGTPFSLYNRAGQVVTALLAPATASLALSIYDRRQLLRQNALPILAGCLAGAVTSMGSVYLLCRLLGLDDIVTRSLLPKSVTTPIASAISESLGGEVPLTVAVVVFTGVIGALLAPAMARLYRVRDPIENGVAIGACSHIVGTSRALEMGETEGAMSALAIGIVGLMTVLLSLFLG